MVKDLPELMTPMKEKLAKTLPQEIHGKALAKLEVKHLEMGVEEGEYRAERHGKVTIDDDSDGFKEEGVVEAEREVLVLLSHRLENHAHVIYHPDY